MTATAALFLLLLLTIKHFFIDFPMQGPYQWMNKGTYGHPGGILHSGLHAFATFVIVGFYTDLWTANLIMSGEFLAHYHIDWAKMNINKKMGWAANTHPQFWTLLGIDQLLHSLTYLVIVWYLV